MATNAGKAVVHLGMDSSDLGPAAARAEKTIGRMASRVRAGIAIAATALATLQVGRLGREMISLAADAEQTEVAFTTLTGSAEKAQRVIKELTDFAATTPFELGEVKRAGQTLLAFGEDAEQIPKTLRMVGDVASAVGIPLNEMAEIYGKARVQNRLFMEDINQLTGRGIPIIDELAKQFGVAESEVRNLVSSGQVEFRHLEKAFENMTSEGGMFANMMEAQSKTLAGQWSNMNDMLQQVGTTIGTSMLPGLKRVLELINANNDATMMWARNFGEIIGDVADMAADGMGGLSGGDTEALKQEMAEIQARKAEIQELIRKSAQGELDFRFDQNHSRVLSLRAKEMQELVKRENELRPLLEARLQVESRIAEETDKMADAAEREAAAREDAKARMDAGPIGQLGRMLNSPEFKEAADKQLKVQDAMAKLRSEAERVGMSIRELTEARFRDMGASDDQAKKAGDLAQAMEDAELGEKRGQKITDIISDLRNDFVMAGKSPLEAALAQVRTELEALQAGPDEISEALDLVRGRFAIEEEKSKTDERKPQAQIVGFEQVFDRIARATASMSGGDRETAVAKQAADAAKRGADASERGAKASNSVASKMDQAIGILSQIQNTMAQRGVFS